MNRFADMLRASCEVNDDPGFDFIMLQACSLLIEETIIHSFSEEIHNLLLNQPVTLELEISLLPRGIHSWKIILRYWVVEPARDVIHVALINSRNPPKLPVIPGVWFSTARLHHSLPKPLNRLLEHSVKGPENNVDRIDNLFNILVFKYTW